jgi:hypothetical protein
MIQRRAGARLAVQRQMVMPLRSAVPKLRPPRNSAARVETPATGIATICVTEAHMDNFWSKLSLEEKANLFQRQLEGA